jgi:hypothetical protein
MSEQMLLDDMMEFTRHASYENLMRLIKKHASPYKLSNRGLKYHHDLLNKYMLGNKINDDKILILAGLHTFGSNSGQLDEDISDEIFNEIKTKYDIGDNIGTIVHYLNVKGHLEDNLDFNPLFHSVLTNKIKELDNNKLYEVHNVN